MDVSGLFGQSTSEQVFPTQKHHQNVEIDPTGYLASYHFILLPSFDEINKLLVVCGSSCLATFIADIQWMHGKKVHPTGFQENAIF